MRIIANPMLLLTVLAVALPVVRVAAVTPFLDMVPVVSQVKSLLQLAMGDVDGSRETLENFLDDGVVVSQVKSLYHLVTGDPQKAYDGQSRFVDNMGAVMDSVPIVGHIKSIALALEGDTKGSLAAARQATSTTGAIVGGMLGGPVGFAAGHVAADGMITLLDMALQGADQAQPHGIVDLIMTANDRTSSEIIDGVASLVTGGIGGSVKPLPVEKPVEKPVEMLQLYEIETPTLVRVIKRYDRVEEIINKTVLDEALEKAPAP